ncbi:MAG: molybdopterin-guanine dinucleotide biosynthesis protein B [Collinsella aerofaciens]
MAKSRYADATKAARRAAMSAHKVTAAATDAVADAQPTASAATEPARDARRDELTHVDAKGEVRMVDVSDKAETHRIAIAEGTILMHPETQAMVLQDRAKKGDVLACARVAGIMAIKRTSDIIPMCHPLLITKSKCDIVPIAPAGTPAEDVPEGWAPARADGQVGFHVLVTAGVTGKTGIEMEALTGASAACLTIYDMCKAVDRGMEIVDVRLLHKEGGRSGIWDRAERQADAVEAVAADGAAPASAPVAVAPAAPTPAVPAIAFIGYQNSGKTTLVEKVIAELTRRGLRVGSLKHHGHHGFDIDVPAKDTWRHHQAGSKHVGLICATRWAEYADTREEDEMPARELLSRYNDVDVVIIEGYKTEGSTHRGRVSGVDLRGKSSLDLVDGHTLACLASPGASGLRRRLCDPSHQHQRRPSHLRPDSRSSGLKPAKMGQVYFDRFYLGKRRFHHKGARHLCGGFCFGRCVGHALQSTK